MSLESKPDMQASIRLSDHEITIVTKNTRIVVPLAEVDTVVAMLQAGQTLMRSVGANAHIHSPDTHPPSPVNESTKITASSEAERQTDEHIGARLFGWLKKNPGRYSERELMAEIFGDKATDDSARQALLEALNQGLGSKFDVDDKGRWSLQQRQHKLRKARLTVGRKKARTQPPAEHMPETGSGTHPPAETEPSNGEKKSEAVKERTRTAQRSPRTLSKKQQTRWRVSQTTVERARRNLLGLVGNAPDTSQRDPNS